LLKSTNKTVIVDFHCKPNEGIYMVGYCAVCGCEVQMWIETQDQDYQLCERCEGSEEAERLGFMEYEVL
jgi:hypothetical protein